MDLGIEIKEECPEEEPYTSAEPSISVNEDIVDLPPIKIEEPELKECSYDLFTEGSLNQSTISTKDVKEEEINYSSERFHEDASIISQLKQEALEAGCDVTNQQAANGLLDVDIDNHHGFEDFQSEETDMKYKILPSQIKIECFNCGFLTSMYNTFKYCQRCGVEKKGEHLISEVEDSFLGTTVQLINNKNSQALIKSGKKKKHMIHQIYLGESKIVIDPSSILMNDPLSVDTPSSDITKVNVENATISGRENQTNGKLIEVPEARKNTLWENVKNHNKQFIEVPVDPLAISTHMSELKDDPKYYFLTKNDNISSQEKKISKRNRQLKGAEYIDRSKGSSPSVLAREDVLKKDNRMQQELYDLEQTLMGIEITDEEFPNNICCYCQFEIDHKSNRVKHLLLCPKFRKSQIVSCKDCTKIGLKANQDCKNCQIRCKVKGCVFTNRFKKVLTLHEKGKSHSYQCKKCQWKTLDSAQYRDHILNKDCKTKDEKKPIQTKPNQQELTDKVPHVKYADDVLSYHAHTCKKCLFVTSNYPQYVDHVLNRVCETKYEQVQSNKFYRNPILDAIPESKEMRPENMIKGVEPSQKPNLIEQLDINAKRKKSETNSEPFSTKTIKKVCRNSKRQMNRNKQVPPLIPEQKFPKKCMSCGLSLENESFLMCPACIYKNKSRLSLPGSKVEVADTKSTQGLENCSGMAEFKSCDTISKPAVEIIPGCSTSETIDENQKIENEIEYIFEDHLDEQSESSNNDENTRLKSYIKCRKCGFRSKGTRKRAGGCPKCTKEKRQQKNCIKLKQRDNFARMFAKQCQKCGFKSRTKLPLLIKCPNCKFFHRDRFDDRLLRKYKRKTKSLKNNSIRKTARTSKKNYVLDKLAGNGKKEIFNTVQKSLKICSNNVENNVNSYLKDNNLSKHSKIAVNADESYEHGEENHFESEKVNNPINQKLLETKKRNKESGFEKFKKFDSGKNSLEGYNVERGKIFQEELENTLSSIMQEFPMKSLKYDFNSKEVSEDEREIENEIEFIFEDEN